MAAPVFRHYGGDERMDRTEIPVADATEVKPGWLVTLESSTLELLNAATDDQYFAGVAMTGHKQNKDRRSGISLAEKCVIEVDVVSASYVRGAGLKVDGTDSGDSIKLVADGGANTVAWAAETKATTTRLAVTVDVWALQKLRGAVNA